MLSFVEGWVPVDPFPRWVLSERVRLSLARLLAEFHQAVEAFVVPEPARWGSCVPAVFAGSCVCHSDAARENVVCRNGEAVALIDFDRVALADPVWDLSSALLQWIPLLGDDGEDVRTAARRIASFCDAYGLPSAERSRVLDGISAMESQGYAMLRNLVEAGHEEYIRVWAAGAPRRIEERLGWLERNRGALVKVMS